MDNQSLQIQQLQTQLQQLQGQVHQLQQKISLLQNTDISSISSRLNIYGEYDRRKFDENHFILMGYSYPGKIDNYNLGDNIQTIALRSALTRLFPQAKFSWEDRENLINYNGETAYCVYQGWFSHRKLDFLPSKNIRPIFLGTCFDPIIQEPITLLHKETAFFRRHEIGCRDLSTKRICDSLGIKNYFSRCLTLTLPKLNIQKKSTVYFVNIPQALEKFFPSKMTKDCIRINQNYLRTTVYPSNQERMKIAERLLMMYACASCVVTSAIHCAMPCLAMGIPVILLPPRYSSERFSVLAGILKLNSIQDLIDHKVNFTPEPINIEPLKKLLLENLKLSIHLAQEKTVDLKSIMNLRQEIANFHI